MADLNEITIIDMDLRSRGIGKKDGKAVFIPDAVTGDTVQYETVLSKKRYDIGKLCSITEESDLRRVPECACYGDCGGCSFIHIRREYELAVKRKSVESAFRRAGVHGITVRDIIHGTDKRYRNKGIFHLNENGEYGFFAENTHDAVSASCCLLIPEIFCRILSFTEQYFRDNITETPPNNIMLRLGHDGIMIVAEAKTPGSLDSYLNHACARISEITSAYTCDGYPADHKTKFNHRLGDKTIRTNLCGTALDISPKSFFQVNDEIASRMCEAIAEMLSPSEGDTILDLYCGIGTIGLTVAKHFPHIHLLGIEINESAVRDAENNCANSDIDNARFICADAGAFKFDGISPYAVIVDPPRFGLSDSMIQAILKMDPKVIIYMSCDPGTLAGDSIKLINGGYEISDCIAGDMFPRCPHVETIVQFKREE